MPDITFSCPSCKQGFEAPAEMADTMVECPTCKEMILVPRQGNQLEALAVKTPPHSPEKDVLPLNKYPCSHCNQPLAVPGKESRHVQCPNCNAFSIVPALGAETAKTSEPPSNPPISKAVPTPKATVMSVTSKHSPKEPDIKAKVSGKPQSSIPTANNRVSIEKGASLKIDPNAFGNGKSNHRTVVVGVSLAVVFIAGVLVAGVSSAWYMSRQNTGVTSTPIQAAPTAVPATRQQGQTAAEEAKRQEQARVAARTITVSVNVTNRYNERVVIKFDAMILMKYDENIKSRLDRLFGIMTEIDEKNSKACLDDAEKASKDFGIAVLKMDKLSCVNKLFDVAVKQGRLIGGKFDQQTAIPECDPDKYVLLAQGTYDAQHLVWVVPTAIP